MKLELRLELLGLLKKYMVNNPEDWNNIKELAYHKNNWFIREFTDYAIKNICNYYLDENILLKLCNDYNLYNVKKNSIGLIMAGNIPMVGFQDWLFTFLCGQKTFIKFSSKDNVLLNHLINYIQKIEPKLEQEIFICDNIIKNADAFITMGGDNSNIYFKKYFSKFPLLSRNNKTSIAILNGNETDLDLKNLANDICLYFGLGCRSVTKLYLPLNYDITLLLNSFNNFSFFEDIKKYKNNYDYNLTLLLLDKKKYYSNNILIFSEDINLFSPLGKINFEMYDPKNFDNLILDLNNNENIQCVIDNKNIKFGSSQNPCLTDFPDKKNTLNFIKNL